MKRLGLQRDAAQDAYQMIRDALVPVPTEKGVELKARWQAIALNTKPKRNPAEYMDLRFVNEAIAELGQRLRALPRHRILEGANGETRRVVNAGLPVIRRSAAP